MVRGHVTSACVFWPGAVQRFRCSTTRACDQNLTPRFAALTLVLPQAFGPLRSASAQNSSRQAGRLLSRLPTTGRGKPMNDSDSSQKTPRGSAAVRET